MTLTEQMRDVEHQVAAMFSGEVTPKSTHNDLNDSVTVKFNYKNAVTTQQLEKLLEIGHASIKRSGNGLCVTLEYFV